MQKYMMFEDVKATQIMYPSGKIVSRAQCIETYPILGTSLGVAGFTCGKDGNIGDIALLFTYQDIYTFEDMFEKQGVVFTDAMDSAQKCEAVTAFVNTTKTEPTV